MPPGFQHTVDFRDDAVRGVDVLQNGFGDDGIESGIAEWQGVSISDNIDFGGHFDFEVDDVCSATLCAGTEIQDFGIWPEVLEQVSDTAIPSWGGIGTSNEVR